VGEQAQLGERLLVPCLGHAASFALGDRRVGARAIERILIERTF
jgi:hypothetical protein